MPTNMACQKKETYRKVQEKKNKLTQKNDQFYIRCTDKTPSSSSSKMTRTHKKRTPSSRACDQNIKRSVIFCDSSCILKSLIRDDNEDIKREKIMRREEKRK